MLLRRSSCAGKSKVGTLVHDGCQARHLKGKQGKQGKGRKGRGSRRDHQSRRAIIAVEVDSNDATMTRKTRDGQSPFGSQGSQWCVHAGVDADEAPGPKTQDQQASDRASSRDWDWDWDGRPCRERPCKTECQGTKWRDLILECKLEKRTMKRPIPMTFVVNILPMFCGRGKGKACSRKAFLCMSCLLEDFSPNF